MGGGVVVTGVIQSVKHQALDLGSSRDLRFMRLSLELGCTLSGESASLPLSLPFPLHLPTPRTRSCTLVNKFSNK